MEATNTIITGIEKSGLSGCIRLSMASFNISAPARMIMIAMITVVIRSILAR